MLLREIISSNLRNICHLRKVYARTTIQGIKKQMGFYVSIEKNRKMKLEIASLRKICKRKEEINNTKKTW